MLMGTVIGSGIKLKALDSNEIVSFNEPYIDIINTEHVYYLETNKFSSKHHRDPPEKDNNIIIYSSSKFDYKIYSEYYKYYFQVF